MTVLVEVVVTITDENDDVYWVERFPSEATAAKWLAEEQTRPYYKPEYVVTTELVMAEVLR